MSVATSPQPIRAPRVGPAATFGQALVFAWRGLAKVRMDPMQLIDVVVQPVTTLVAFSVVFGGAVAGDTVGYLQYLVPGLMVQNVLLATFAVGIALNNDLNTGVIDRFRSMPLARSALLVGAVLAGSVRYAIALLVLLLTAAILGFRAGTGFLPFASAIALMLLAGLAFCWLTVFLAMLVRTPSSVQAIMLAFVLPLTFGSNVFVPTQALPGWLGGWSSISPVSLLADAMRALLTGGPTLGPVVGALTWLSGIAVLFFPLAMYAYRRRVHA